MHILLLHYIKMLLLQIVFCTFAMQEGLFQSYFEARCNPPHQLFLTHNMPRKDTPQTLSHEECVHVRAVCVCVREHVHSDKFLPCICVICDHSFIINDSTKKKTDLYEDGTDLGEKVGGVFDCH